MSGLRQAYNSCSGSLKPQKQGTCGLYSFWFASLLLKQVNPTDQRPFVYPRGEGHTHSNSMRKFAKENLNSGQGELLNVGEVTKLIIHYKYSCRSISWSNRDTAKKFIAGSLRSNQPVMFPYLYDGIAASPLSAVPIGRGGFGAHWSLIIDEDPTNYTYIDPNRPYQIQSYAKEQVLDANSIVDTSKLDRYWAKGPSKMQNVPYEFQSGITPLGNAPPTMVPYGTQKIYDIGDSSRAQLANVLVAVY